ncbi:glycoside hydrolase family 1 protein [Lacticaseibacillus absianus]|uniref:glycoside hydrolase family 1 protein n=1 Tax=Lacticaseibacillus absianus TaxID=2729623 RepID=UPI001FE979C9|nr:glycoside hydrolase family 1 protein [Lacticaseibacillus absianus]
MSFADGFLWGASTSAYQYEGATTVDGKGPSVQDTATLAGGLSDFAQGSDGYHRIDEDVALFQQMGLKAYRFSVAWTRLYPDGVHFNAAGLDWYLHLLDQLQAAGIEPLVTLYHFDLPAALAAKGGWADRATIDAYLTYVRTVFDAFGQRVTYYQTVNEQNMVLAGALQQVQAGTLSLQDAVQGNHHLFVAGAAAINLAHAQYPHIKIGPAPNLVAVYPLTPTPVDALAADTYDALRNLMFGDMAAWGRYNQTALATLASAGVHVTITPDDAAMLAAATPDLLYFNYYNSEVVQAATNGPLPFKKVPNPTVPQTEFGWDIDPLGFYLTLRQLWDRYRLPLMVTENGLGAHDTVVAGQVDDPARIAYLREHIAAMARAVADGVTVLGYNVWSAVDVVSTHEGFAKRYGLIHVDRDEQGQGSFDRLPKASFDWYRRVIASNGATLD